MPYLDMTLYGGDAALLLLRIVVAAVFLIHGLMKRGMWKMAPSAQMSGTMLWQMRLLSIIEPIGALGVLLGILTPYAAGALGLVMIAAMYYKIFVWKKKFTGDSGWELDLILLSICIALIALGSGVFALNIPA